MEPVLKQVRTPEDMDLARAIRLEVFVGEQNVPPEIEMDSHDAVATHVLCILGGRAVGTGRIVRMPDGMKLGRVAVLQEHRCTGLGTRIVKWLLERAAESGFREVYANVQVSAEPFYIGLGFSPEGERFSEAGIEHIRMRWVSE